MPHMHTSSVRQKYEEEAHQRVISAHKWTEGARLAPCPLHHVIRQQQDTLFSAESSLPQAQKTIRNQFL